MVSYSRNSELYDLSYLEEISMGEDSIIKELIAIFAESSEDFILSLKKNFNEKQFEKIKKDSHSYYSQIGMLQPKKEIMQSLEKLEILCSQQNNIDEICVIIELLETEIKKIIVNLATDLSINLKK